MYDYVSKHLAHVFRGLQGENRLLLDVKLQAIVSIQYLELNLGPLEE